MSVSASQLRQRALAELGTATGADLCAWFMSDDSGTLPVFGRFDVWSRDAERAAQTLVSLTGSPIEEGGYANPHQKPWMRHQMDLRHAPRKVRNRFRSFDQEVADFAAFTKTPIYGSFYGAADIADQTRMLVYDDDGTHVGWVGVLSHRRLTPEQRRASVDRQLQQRVRSAFVRAHDIEVAAGLALPSPSSFVCTEGGEPVASSPLDGWLDVHRQAVATGLRRARSEVGATTRFVVGGMTVSATSLGPLLGREVVWSCRAEHYRPPRLSPLAALSPRQREVAELVAAGATNPEVAHALGVSLGTVKSHLEAVFRRLGIESRVEVAALVVRDRSQ